MDTQTPEEEILTCSICLETLHEPKVLSCQHRFCESCLKSHIISSAAKSFAPSSCFSCPDCRKKIVAPNPTAPPSAWAALFITDFITKGLIEARKYRQEARRNKESKVRHPCPEHGQVEVNLYCVDCSSCACHICVATTHQNCHHLVTVKKAASDRRTRIQEQLDQIRLILSKASVHKPVQERSLSEVEKNVVLLSKDIRKLSKKTDKLACFLHEAEVTLASFTDVESLVDTKFSADIDSYCEQGMSIDQRYESLSEAFSLVTSILEARSSSSTSLGNSRSQSDINQLNDAGVSPPSSSKTSRSTQSRMPTTQTASANHAQSSKRSRIRVLDEQCGEFDPHMNKKKKS